MSLFIKKKKHVHAYLSVVHIPNVATSSYPNTVKHFGTVLKRTCV